MFGGKAAKFYGSQIWGFYSNYTRWQKHRTIASNRFQ